MKKQQLKLKFTLICSPADLKTLSTLQPMQSSRQKMRDSLLQCAGLHPVLNPLQNVQFKSSLFSPQLINASFLRQEVDEQLSCITWKPNEKLTVNEYNNTFSSFRLDYSSIYHDAANTPTLKEQKSITTKLPK